MIDRGMIDSGMIDSGMTVKDIVISMFACSFQCPAWFFVVVCNRGVLCTIKRKF